MNLTRKQNKMFVLAIFKQAKQNKIIFQIKLFYCTNNFLNTKEYYFMR